MVRISLVKSLIACLLVFAMSRSLVAQEEHELSPEEQKTLAILQSLTWIQGPAEIDVGRHGIIKLNETQVGLNSSDARKYVAALGNPKGNQLALVAGADNSGWFVDFEFEDIGYIEDDEQDDIDADELMKSLREAQSEANKQRKQLRLESLDIRSWAQEPRYDNNFKALTWATRLRGSDSGENINHNIRILGRRGVMTATLVCIPEEYQVGKTQAAAIVKAFQFKSGERYNDFKKGDRIAEYGLKGLILGGGLAVALKTGLLSKIWKFLVIGFLAVVGAIKKMLGIKSKPKKRRRSGSRVRTMEEDEIIE